MYIGVYNLNIASYENSKLEEVTEVFIKETT